MDDLAKSVKHADLATKYQRSIDAIAHFSSRNSAEVATRRQALLGEVADETSHLWITDQARVKARMQDSLDLAWSYVEDESLEPALRLRYQRKHDVLLEKVIEVGGWLPPRTSQVEVTSLMPLGNRLVMTEDGQFHEVTE